MNDHDDHFPPIRRRVRNKPTVPQSDCSDFPVDEEVLPSPNGYQVGYGRPPIPTRFTKGQSGNPRGRPKGALSIITYIERLLEETHEIVEDGQRRKRNTKHILAAQWIRKAAKGEIKAMQMLLNLAKDKQSEAGAPPNSINGEPLSEEEVMIIQRFLLRRE